MKKFVIIFAIIAAISGQLLSPDRLKDILPLVTGGSPAMPGQFPYQVALAMSNTTAISFCGGTLIKHKWVLTAASCFPTYFSEYMVVFGNINLLQDVPAYMFNSTSLSNIEFHPKYNSYTKVNDIALIKIDSMPPKITEHRNVGYIGLPTEDEAKTNLTGLNITISGYGLNTDQRRLDLVMHSTTIKLASNDVCRNFTTIDPGYNVTESTLCIDTTGGKSPCGDQGGPMTIEIGSKKVLVGIMGIGPYPCTAGYPTLGESVFYHREWIETTSSGSSEVALSFSIFAAVFLFTLKNLF